jgi:hypothetical protein
MKTLLATLTAASALFVAGYAAADGPPAKTPPPKMTAAQHEMCGGMMGDKSQMGAMKGPDGKPMAKADMEKMHKMCGEGMKHHGGMAHGKPAAHAPAGAAAPKADPPKAHEHE